MTQNISIGKEMSSQKDVVCYKVFQSKVLQKYIEFCDLVICKFPLFFSSEDPEILGTTSFGGGTGFEIFQGIGCSGTESDISECHFPVSTNPLCTHQKDVGLRCREYLISGA